MRLLAEEGPSLFPPFFSCRLGKRPPDTCKTGRGASAGTSPVTVLRQCPQDCEKMSCYCLSPRSAGFHTVHAFQDGLQSPLLWGCLFVWSIGFGFFSLFSSSFFVTTPHYAVQASLVLSIIYLSFLRAEIIGRHMHVYMCVRAHTYLAIPFLMNVRAHNTAENTAVTHQGTSMDTASRHQQPHC